MCRNGVSDPTGKPGQPTGWCSTWTRSRGAWRAQLAEVKYAIFDARHRGLVPLTSAEQDLHLCIALAVVGPSSAGAELARSRWPSSGEHSMPALVTATMTKRVSRKVFLDGMTTP